eukprot:108074-Chlamydomonas_euryale.AAC.1
MPPLLDTKPTEPGRCSRQAMMFSRVPGVSTRVGRNGRGEDGEAKGGWMGRRQSRQAMMPSRVPGVSTWVGRNGHGEDGEAKGDWMGGRGKLERWARDGHCRKSGLKGAVEGCEVVAG